MFPLHYQKATASINIITASLSMISFTTANSTTLAPLNVTTTSGSSLSSTFSPTSSNSAIGLSPFESYIKNSHVDKDSFIVCVTSEKKWQNTKCFNYFSLQVKLHSKCVFLSFCPNSDCSPKSVLTI